MYVEFNWTAVICTCLFIIKRCCCDSLKLKVHVKCFDTTPKVFSSDQKSSQFVSTKTASSILECAAIFADSDSLAFNYKKDEQICQLSSNYPENGNEEALGWTLVAPIVNGGWNDWTPWSSCSVTCDDGTMSRTRSCQAPPPSNGGTPCIGDVSDETFCTSNQPCTGDILPLGTSSMSSYIEDVYFPTNQAADGDNLTCSIARTSGHTIKPYWRASFGTLTISAVIIYIHKRSHLVGYTVTISDAVLSEDSCLQLDGDMSWIWKCIYTPPTVTQVASDLKIAMTSTDDDLIIYEIIVLS